MIFGGVLFYMFFLGAWSTIGSVSSGGVYNDYSSIETKTANPGVFFFFGTIASFSMTRQQTVSGVFSISSSIRPSTTFSKF